MCSIWNVFSQKCHCEVNAPRTNVKLCCQIHKRQTEWPCFEHQGDTPHHEDANTGSNRSLALTRVLKNPCHQTSCNKSSRKPIHLSVKEWESAFMACWSVLGWDLDYTRWGKFPSSVLWKGNVPCFAAYFLMISLQASKWTNRRKEMDNSRKKFQLPISDHLTAAMLFFYWIKWNVRQLIREVELALPG